MEYKTLHLLRHGQAYHNVEGEIMLQMKSSWKILFDGRWRRLTHKHIFRALRCIWLLLWCSVPAPQKTSPSAIVTPYYEHHDASLTSTGWQQVEEVRKQLRNSGLRNETDLVVVSPLTRTLQTASGVFGGAEYSEGEKLSPLMADNVGRSPGAAMSSSGSPPFVAVELCRERYSTMPCDRRSPMRKIQLQFPGIDFSMIEEEDKFLKANTSETEEELDTRTRAFLEWLSTRTGKEIAVVSHGGFLTNMLRKFGDETVNSTMFANCELRTVKIRKIVTGPEEDYNFELSAA